MARTLYSFRDNDTEWHTLAEGHGAEELRNTEIDAPVGSHVVFRGRVPVLWHAADAIGAEKAAQLAAGSGLAVDDVYGEDGDVVIEGHIRKPKTSVGIVGWIAGILAILGFIGAVALLGYWTIKGDFKPTEITKWVKWGAIGALAVGGTLVLTRTLPRRR